MHASYSFVRVMRSIKDRSSKGTTWTFIPSCFKSSWIRVTIFVRSALVELVKTENSTVFPSPSTSVESPCWPLDHQNPPSFKTDPPPPSEPPHWPTHLLTPR